MNRLLRFSLLAAVASMVVAATLHAQSTRLWLGTIDTDFSNPGNWNVTTPFVDGDVLYINVDGTWDPQYGFKTATISSDIATLFNSVRVGWQNGPASIVQTAGSLNVTNGIYIGSTGGNASYLISGGTLTKTTFTDSVWLGDHLKTGVMEVTGGATVSLAGKNYAGGIFIGSFSGSGLLTVTDSTFTNQGPVLLGYAGTGEIVLNGTSVFTAGNDVLIGSVDGAVGSGTLTVNDNATFECTNAGSPRGVKVGNGGNGVVNLNGGTFATHSVGGTTGGTFNFNGGTLKALAENSDWLSANVAYKVKSGGAVIDTNAYNVVSLGSLVEDSNSTGGGLVKNGVGMLTLAAVNSYTGATTVNAGVLRLAAADALPGTVTVNADATLSLAANMSIDGKINGTAGSYVSVDAGNATYGTNAFSGTMIVNGGNLALNGTHAGSLFVNNIATWYHNGTGTVAGLTTVGNAGTSQDALLGGTGTLGDVTVLTNFGNSYGVKGGLEAGQNGSGSLHVANLTFAGEGFVYVGNSTSGLGAYTGTNAAIIASGSLTFGGSNYGSVKFDLGGTAVASGTYHLIQHVGPITYLNGTSLGTFQDNVINAVLSARQTASLVDNAGAGSTRYVDLVVSGFFPIWSGKIGAADDNTWYQNNSAKTNWKASSDNSSTYFIDSSVATNGIGDTVLFNDAAGVGHNTVAIPQNVAPISVTVDSTIPYTFTGAAGIVDGPSATKTSLIKKNTGTLTINTVNSYSGGTKIGDGTITLGNALALGTGPVTFFPGATSTAKLQLNGNSIFISGLATDAVTPGTPVVENGGSIEAVLTLTNEANNTFAGTIQDGGAGKLGVTFAGFGSFVLAGVNTYSGDTTVSGNGNLLRIGIDNALPHGTGKGAVVFGGGNLDLNSRNVVVNSLLTPGSLAIVTNSAAATTSTLTVGDGDASSDYGGGIRDNGTGKIALVKIGSGLLALGNPGVAEFYSDYSGGTTLSAGTIQTGYITALGIGSLDMASGTTLDVNGALNVGGLSGDGLITTTYTSSSVLIVTSAASAATSFVGLIENGSGTLSLTKAGAGSLTLASANTYSGATSVNGGKLLVPVLANGGVISSIGQSSADPASLVLGGGTLHYTGPSIVLDRGFVNNGGGIKTDNDLTIQGAILSGNGNFAKSGPGTLTFANPSTDIENPNALSRFFVNEGTASFTSGIYNAVSIYVGLDGGPAVMEQSSGSISYSNELIVGCDGGHGDYFMSGGSITKTGANGSSVWIGLRKSGNMELSNGAVFNLIGEDWDGGFFVGAYGGDGSVTVTDATFDTSGPVFVGFLNGSNGEMILNGSATATASNDLLIGVYGGHGSLTLNGNASLVNINPDSPRKTQLGGDGTGDLNLNGGTFTTTAIGGNANGTVNFNGGALKAASESADWLNSSLVCNMQAGGAIIDTNGVNVTTGVSLKHGGLVTDPDGGLKKIGDGALTLTGALSYQGDTTVNQGALTITALNTPSAAVYVATGATLNATSIVADTLTIGGAPITGSAAAAVPEPGTMVLLALAGVVALLAWRRR